MKIEIIEKYIFKIILLSIFNGILNCNGQDEECIVKETNITGECKPARQCPSVYQLLEQGLKNFTQCIGSKQIIVCCPLSKKPVIQSRITELVSHKEKCHEYQQYVYNTIYTAPQIPGGIGKELKIDNCGLKNIDLISGGRDAKPRQFPHMAALGWIRNEILHFQCGGSLISERYILTAAHCMRESNPQMVRLGDLNINSNDDDAKPEDIKVQQVIIHPKYNPNKKSNDIALIKLSYDVKFSEYKRPACLASVHDWNGTEATATGWGHIDNYDIYGSDILQEVTIEKFTQDECQEKFDHRKDRFNIAFKVSYSTQVCLGSKTDKRDSCKGDSGGPLQIFHSFEYCMWEIVGVTSYGPSGCGQATVPGVYTRVFAYIDWIESIVWN